jgi:hypothetical protein
MNMSIRAILLPLFVEVALTFGLVIWLAVLRVTGLRNGTVDPSRIALREPNWPLRATQVGNSVNNQFELPVLFYVLTILEIMTHHADLVFVVLAWIFVLARIAHAYEHTTSNVVRRRGPLYGIGLAVLLIAWVIFVVRILLGVP